MTDFSLPPAELLHRQSAWLAPARARLLRRVQIARRRRVLDLACGSGAVTAELVRRCGGRVVVLDRSRRALASGDTGFAGALRVRGDAVRLPFARGSFDLVFCQFALMWLDAVAAVREIGRVLKPGGVLVAVEADYAAMIEHPAELATAGLWLAALSRAGADPRTGRKLPGLLAAGGFRVRVDLLDRLVGPSRERFDLLRELPLTEGELQALRRIEAADAACDDAGRVVHLPMFLVTALK
jgi:SAM-dependent methyltransferase